MKKIATLVLGLIFTGLFAQEQSIKQVIGAVSSGDFAMAIQKGQTALQELKAKPNSVSPEDLAEFYFSLGKAYQQSGSLEEAMNYWGKVGEVESKTYYTAKNKDTRQDEYYWDKSEAEAAVSQGNYNKLKDKSPTPKFTDQLKASLSESFQTAANQAAKDYSAEKFSEASKGFERTYMISKAIGNTNYLQLYYAAVAAAQAEEHTRAFNLYKQVKETGYDGVETRYYAMNKSTGEEVQVNKSELNLIKLDPNYGEVRTETSDPITRDVDLGILRALFNTNAYDPIVETIRKEYVGDSDIANFVRNIYIKSDSMDKLEMSLKEKVKTNPTAADFADLGSLALDKNNYDEAKEYFAKALEINPDDSEILTTIAYTILLPEKEYVEKINANLGDSANEKKVRAEYTKKRQRLYEEALPFLERAYELKSDDTGIVHDLRMMYKELDMRDKARELLEVEKQLRGNQ